MFARQEHVMASNNDPLHGQQILPFYLVGDTGSAPVVRGRLASVGRAATSILDRHGYPLAVASLQAELDDVTARAASAPPRPRQRRWHDGHEQRWRERDGWRRRLLTAA